MAFSFGNLLATAASARASARRGQREQRQMDAEAERQSRLDQFNEYARSRQLAQTDNAQQNLMERAQDQLTAREAIAARDAQIRDYKTREDARLAQEKLNRESGMDQADPTKGYRGADRGAKIQMNDADNQTALTTAQIRAMAAIQAAAERNNKPKAVPQQISRAFLENQKQVRTIDDAIKEVEANPNSVGLKGYLPGAILDRMPTRGGAAGVDARAWIADVGSLEIRDRSGAAVTASEFPRLRPFIPSDKDDSQTVLKKLRRMQQIIAEENQAMSEFYGEDQGYAGFTPSASTGSPSPAPQAPATAPRDSRPPLKSLRDKP